MMGKFSKMPFSLASKEIRSLVSFDSSMSQDQETINGCDNVWLIYDVEGQPHICAADSIDSKFDEIQRMQVLDEGAAYIGIYAFSESHGDWRKQGTMVLTCAYVAEGY